MGDVHSLIMQGYGQIMERPLLKLSRIWIRLDGVSRLQERVAWLGGNQVMSAKVCNMQRCALESHLIFCHPFFFLLGTSLTALVECLLFVNVPWLQLEAQMGPLKGDVTSVK